MSTPILKLIYKNKTKNNNTVIQNAIAKTKLQTKIQSGTQLNTTKNTKKNKKDKKNNLTKRKKIKEKPQIILQSADPNNIYIVMITSKSEPNDSRKKETTYINWLSIINSDVSKEDELIPYKIQKTNKSIYKFKIHLYSLSNDENVTEKINNIKEIININIKKSKKNNDYTEMLNSIEPSLGKNIDNREFIINTKYNKFKKQAKIQLVGQFISSVLFH